MHIIKPIVIEPDTDVSELSVPMDDVYEAWSPLVRYNKKTIVTTGEGEDQKIWEARHDIVPPIDPSSSLPPLYNEGVDPTQTNVVGRTNEGSLISNATEYHYFGEGWWRDATEDKYLQNRFRMFDPNPAHYTETDVNISFSLKPSELWSGVALFNVVGDLITVTIQNGPEYSASRNLRYGNPISQEFQNEPQAAFVDLPLIDPAIYPNAQIKIELSVSEPRFLRIGYVCIGESIEIGQASYGLSTELMDFSRFERDTFGTIFTIPRGYSDKITYPYVIPESDIVQTRQILVARRALLTAYIGHPEVPITITYGYFTDLEIPLSDWGRSEASVVVESVLFETPGNTAPLPKVVEFIEYGTTCIESSLGRVFEACLKDGAIEEKVYASILNVTVDPLDSVTWEVNWVVGESSLTHTAEFLTTDCEQYLPVLSWPSEVPVEHLPAIALIKATISKYDGTTINVEPATLIVGECGECGECGGGGGQIPLRAGWVSSSSLAVVENRDAFCRGDFVRLRASYGDGEIELSGESGFQQTFFVDERAGSTGCWPGDCVTYVRLLGGFGDVTADIYRHLPGLGAEKLATLSRDGYGSGALEFVVIPGGLGTFVFVVVKASSAFSTTLSARST